jgi:UDP-glucose 4-epimerase
VFGPLQTAGHAYAAVVPAFVDAALRGDPLTIHGDGLQSRDFTFVGDVCGVLQRALLDGTASDDPVNLAFGGRVTLLELAALLEAELGHPLAREHVAERPGDVRHSQADQTTLRGLFPGLEPVPLADGLRDTVKWFQQGCGPLAAP